MRRELLSTSALVAAGMIADAALATTRLASGKTVDAVTNQPLQITFGGYLYNFLTRDWVDAKPR